MATTIQLRETTKQLLDTLKAKTNEETYDTVILHLLGKERKIKDMFGATRKKPLRFSREDELKFHEL